jgi:TonB family protein
MRVSFRLGGFRSPRSPFVFYSVVAHALLMGAVVFLPTLGRGQRVSNDYIPVKLSGGLPGPPAQAAQPEPEPEPETPAPEPEPTPPPEGARIQEAIPEPAPEKPKKTETQKPRKPAPKPATTPPASTGQAGTGGTGAPTVDLGGARFAWYGDRVGAVLKCYGHPPLLDVAGDALPAATLTFTILRDGTVRNVAVEVSSGVPSLDRSAMRAVIEASPLPPLPADWREPVMPARVTFRAQQ